MCDIDHNRLLEKSLEGILQTVSAETGIPVERIKSKVRKREVVEARQAFMIASKLITGKGSAKRAKIVNRDHATAIHADKNAHIQEINKTVQSVVNLYKGIEPCQ
jgi:chromosomal replication initiation ATPase DnaA